MLFKGRVARLITGCLVMLFLYDGCNEEEVPAPSIEFAVSPEVNAIVHVTRMTCMLLGTGQGLRFVWDFGDGYISKETIPTHIYSREGTFTVTLTATDKSGVATYRSKNITVGNLSGVWSADKAPADTYFELVQTGANLAGTDYENGKAVDSLIGQLSDPMNVTWKNSYSEFSGTVSGYLSVIFGTVKYSSGGSASATFRRR